MNHIQLQIQEATKLINLNKLSDAYKILLKVSQSSPNNAHAYHLLAVIFGLTDEYDKSEIYCKKVLSLNKKAFVALNNMGVAQKYQGKYDAAKKSFQNAINIQKNYIEAYINLANLFLDIEKTDNAETIITTALKINKNNPALNLVLGNLYLKQDKHTDAINIYKKILESEPNYTDAIINLGQIYEHLGNFNIAINYYSDALKLIPNYDLGLIGIGSILEKQGKYEKALEVIMPAIEHSTSMKLQIVYGRINSRLNNFTKAVETLTKAKNLAANDQHNQELLYELGDAQDKLAHYDEAYSSYYAANQINKTNFNREQSTKEFLSIKKTYTSDTLKKLENSENSSTQPIFIVGMPRSGTSLVEQILANHSQIFGGGELEYIDDAILYLESTTKNMRYPDTVPILKKLDLQKSAEVYIEKIKTLSNNAQFITNKMPHNFLHLGLIQQLLPNAKIIHCTRDEKDTALSIYFHQFNTNHPYANDLNDLHFYYQQYKDLINHWNRELSLNIFTINYEELINIPEARCRQLIEFCNLSWEQNCLNFHNSERLVNTPSYYQVKQPLYKNSINRHLNYMAHLDNFGNE